MFVNFFITRPVFATVCSLLIVLAGAISIPTLPIAQFPSLAPPQVTVTSNYIGANSQSVETTVTTIPEEAINGAEGMRYMTSSSGNDGTSSIVATFALERNLDIASVDVQNRAFTVLGRLPQEVQQTGLTVTKNSGSFVVAMGFYSKDGRYDPLFISNYLSIYVQDALKRVSGVGNVIIFGERRLAIRVWLDPDKLAKRQLTPADVTNAIRTQNVQVAFDPTTAVSDSIRDVLVTLIEAVIIVIVVIYLFLQGWRSTLIPAITIPVSLIGTFAFIKLFGFSINTLTLFGITLATGLVVDDAIVVIENIERHIHEYHSPAGEAASTAMSEVTSAVIATALVLAAVFVPVAFFPGTTGRLYQQFALTIAFSMAISAFNALTLTPALSALLLAKVEKPKGFFFRGVNRAIDGGTGFLVGSLRRLVRMRGGV